METRFLQTIALLAYQLTLLFGIVLFPVAVLVNKVGLHLPMDRVLGWLDRVYERANAR
jgi:hypothetical protein